MNKFWKTVWAVVVGVLFYGIIMGIITLIFSTIFSAIILASTKSEVPDNSLLTLTFDAQVVDHASSNPFDNFDFTSMSMDRPIGLSDMIQTIKTAADDERIRGIYLELSQFTSDYGGIAAIEEIYKALTAFKASGKPIYAYTEYGYSQGAYYLACTADSLFAAPLSSTAITGMGGSLVFYKDMLSKVGVTIDLIRVGKFKSAGEPFIASAPSEENKRQNKAFLTAAWEVLSKGIAEGRGITVEKLDKLVNSGKTILDNEAMVENNLFDGLIPADKMNEILKSTGATDRHNKLNLVSYEDYLSDMAPEISLSRNQIALIYAEGDIIEGKGKGNNIGTDLANKVRKAAENNKVKAIVLRINSGGGSATTSEVIWNEVRKAAENKPFVVSMGNAAASGGYYIACPADTIVADPGTLTGSIGVFGMSVSGTELYEKIGLNGYSVKTHEYGDFGGVMPMGLPVANRKMTSSERKIMQHSVDVVYDTFLSHVAEGRGMTKEEVHEIAQGRVWAGSDAIEIGLIDLLGGLDRAIEVAAEMANLTDYELKEIPARQGTMDALFELFSTGIKSRIVEKEMGSYYPMYQLKEALSLLDGTIQTRLPYFLDINM